jgi:hypothetical protein
LPQVSLGLASDMCFFLMAFGTRRPANMNSIS